MSIKSTLNPDLARQFFNIMGATVDEFRMHISKEGWKVAAVDPANVALTIIDLPKDNFENYEFESGWTSSIDGHDTGVFTSSLFSLDYLCDIAEKIPSDTVWLHLGHDYPCILSFVLGRTGKVEYKIAPRIQDD